MSLFQDYKLKRRKTSSVLVVEQTSKSTSSQSTNYVQQTSSLNSSNGQSSPTPLNRLLIQRTNSPTNFVETNHQNNQRIQQPQPQQSNSNNETIFSTTTGSVIVANKRAYVDQQHQQINKNLNGNGPQTCAVITCGTKSTANKTNNKTVIQQYRSNSFSSSNSSLSPSSSSPPTPLLPINTHMNTIHNSNQNYHLNQNSSKLNSTKLVNSTNLSNSINCFNNLLQHSQSINSSGCTSDNSSPPSASSPSSLSPPPSSAASLFEIDSDQCLDLTSSSISTTNLNAVSLTTCSLTLTTTTLSNHNLNSNKSQLQSQTIITKPFIAHQTIIKLQPQTQDLNTNTTVVSNARCSNLEHSNLQLHQTAKSNRCLTTTRGDQLPTLLAIDTTNKNQLNFQNDLNLSSNKSTNSTSSNCPLNSSNINQNSFRQVTKGQTFMLATTEHIPTTFNQFTHHSNTTNSTALVSNNCKTTAATNNLNSNGSPKTMLWTLVNSGSIVNANILFATIPTTTTSTLTNTNLKNNKQQDNSKLTVSTPNSLVQCIKPANLVNNSNGNHNKCLTNTVLTSAPTPVLKYTTFVTPNTTTLTTSTTTNKNVNVDEKLSSSCITSNVSLKNRKKVILRSLVQ